MPHNSWRQQDPVPIVDRAERTNVLPFRGHRPMVRTAPIAAEDFPSAAAARKLARLCQILSEATPRVSDPAVLELNERLSLLEGHFTPAKAPSV